MKDFSHPPAPQDMSVRMGGTQPHQRIHLEAHDSQIRVGGVQS